MAVAFRGDVVVETEEEIRTQLCRQIHHHHFFDERRVDAVGDDLAEGGYEESTVPVMTVELENDDLEVAQSSTGLRTRTSMKSSACRRWLTGSEGSG